MGGHSSQFEVIISGHVDKICKLVAACRYYSVCTVCGCFGVQGDQPLSTHLLGNATDTTSSSLAKKLGQH